MFDLRTQLRIYVEDTIERTDSDDVVAAVSTGLSTEQVNHGGGLLSRTPPNRWLSRSVVSDLAVGAGFATSVSVSCIAHRCAYGVGGVYSGT